MSASHRSQRPLIMGRYGAVGTNHPLATQAGLDALRAGGGAADAAVASGLTLGVVEPHMSGLGGDGFYHVFAAGRSDVFNGTGAAPVEATPDRFSAAGIPLRGPHSASTPGMLAGLSAMHAAHGRLPWSRLCDHAIAHARYGFAVTHHHARFTAESLSILAADERSAMTLLDGGNAPKLAHLIRQPALARTLEEIAVDGAETFYRGRLARRLSAGCRDAGALIAEADLAACEAERQDAITVTYRGYTVAQTPPNSTGFVMLLMLKIVERFELSALSDAERIHIMVEAKKRAFLDRERFGTDPRFAAVSLDRLLSDAYADECAADIDRGRAAAVPLAESEARHGDTSYFCVVDAAGEAVSGIQSLNSAFGSGVTAGDTGILLNNRMAYWHLRPAHPNRLQAGKRVRHTMNAPVVTKDGALWAVLGTPGADHQVQVNLQVLVSLVELGADPQQAVDAPRWTSSQPGQGANWPHAGDGALSVEPGFGEQTLRSLASLGHSLNRLGPLEGPCSVQVIRVLPNGVRMAGSDPRRDGWAAAY